MPRRRILFPLAAVLVILALLDWGAMVQWVAYGQPELTNLGFEARFARTTWLPGPNAIIPSQPCPRCRADDHERCASKTETLILGTKKPRKSGRVRSSTATAGILVVPIGTRVGPPPTLKEFTIELEDVEMENGEIRCTELSLPGSGVDRSIFRCDCCVPDE